MSMSLRGRGAELEEGVQTPPARRGYKSGISIDLRAWQPISARDSLSLGRNRSPVAGAGRELSSLLWWPVGNCGVREAERSSVR